MESAGTLADVGLLEEFSHLYKDWMKLKMDPDGRYQILMDMLFELEYVPFMEQDENRATDGVYLRTVYEYESGVEIRPGWMDWPCSVLEMLVALAIKVEDTVMHDMNEGDRTAVWFWEMLDNMGLSGCTDAKWRRAPKNTSAYVSDVVDIFLRRSYYRDGIGGIGCLFPMENPPFDLRETQIWDQMNAYFWRRWQAERGEKE